MGLKRFDNKLPEKEKHYKPLIITICICIIAGLSLTSYALYQVRDKKDIVNSKVGKFHTSDVSLVILVDGNKVDTFPTKNSGKSFLGLSCTNSGVASWDKVNWELSIQKTTGPTECTIEFGTLYADASGAESPELNNGLIPVTYNSTTGNWEKANIKTKWYDYDEQWWANAVTVTSSSRSTYTSASAGTAISMSDIETMWVWIPRYEYQHTNLANQYAGGTQALPGGITINFISKDTTTPSSSNFTIHDAFWWDNNNNGTKDSGEQLAGIWVAKFEMSAANATSNTLQAPIIKPNVTSWRNAQVGTFWNSIHNSMNGTSNQYGLSNSDAHLMKNMEWGSVAYLSQSKYGKYGNSAYTGANKKVANNNCNTFKTGIGGDTVSAPQSSSTCTTNTYETAKGQTASTTGNIYGIYDMSGGAVEYVMGIQKVNGSNEPAVGRDSSSNSGWSGKLYNGTEYTGTYGQLKEIGSKYYDLYDYGTSYTDYTRYHKGDATYEVTASNSASTYTGWYSDEVLFVRSFFVFFIRGGACSNAGPGVFYFNGHYGSVYHGGRPVIARAS